MKFRVGIIRFRPASAPFHGVFILVLLFSSADGLISVRVYSDVALFKDHIETGLIVFKLIRPRLRGTAA